MEKNEVQFIIDGKKIYLEKQLIVFQIPLLFICIDKKGNRYTVLTVDDSDEYKYIIIQSNIEDIIYMLKGKITIRELINRANYRSYWFVETNNTINVVNKKKLVDIPVEFLPDEEIVFNIDNIDIEEYVDILFNDYDKIGLTTFEKVYFVCLQIGSILILASKEYGLFYKHYGWLTAYIVFCILLDLKFFRK